MYAGVMVTECPSVVWVFLPILLGLLWFVGLAAFLMLLGMTWGLESLSQLPLGFPFAWLLLSPFACLFGSEHAWLQAPHGLRARIWATITGGLLSGTIAIAGGSLLGWIFSWIQPRSESYVFLSALLLLFVAAGLGGCLGARFADRRFVQPTAEAASVGSTAIYASQKPENLP